MLYKNILIYYIGLVAPNNVNPLYLIIYKATEYIKESNGSKSFGLTLLMKAKKAEKV